MPTSSFARPSQIYPNRDFWFENMPSGNPGLEERKMIAKVIEDLLIALEGVSVAFTIREKVHSSVSAAQLTCLLACRFMEYLSFFK
jgi:hypothetical protein